MNDDVWVVFSQKKCLKILHRPETLYKHKDNTTSPISTVTVDHDISCGRGTLFWVRRIASTLEGDVKD